MKIMSVFGTRPEAIKMCPLIKEFQSHADITSLVCITGQHRDMLKEVLETFTVKPDYDLNIMKKEQDLFDITINILDKIKSILIKEKPDLVLVHGDTSTTFTTALACFYLNIPIGHIEAGLRTYNMTSPFPEEFNRQAVGLVANYHFAPTEQAKKTLLAEGKDPKSIFVTGNTAIDALKTTINPDFSHPILEWAGSSKIIMITAHRRENIGKPMEHMFHAIKRIVKEHPDIKCIYPVHMNPKIKALATSILGENDRIKLIPPMNVVDFHNLLNKSYLILTDSGGIQEEAPSLGKPVLVMRDTTERPEGIKAGTLKLTGTTEEEIYKQFKLLLTDPAIYKQMSRATNPYGDGFASKKIIDILLQNHCK